MVQIINSKPIAEAGSKSDSHLGMDVIPLIRSDEFLPSVSRLTSLGGLFLVFAVGSTIALSSIAKYNVAVRASATVRPAGELRVVQAELEGTVKEIQVQENQSVRRGDIIAYLDDTKLQIQKSQLHGSIQQSQLQIEQIEAQIRLLNAQIAAESRSIDGAIAAAQADTRRNQREYEERQLTTQADFAEAQAALEYAQTEKERYQRLVGVGAISELQVREKETAVRTAEARLERTQAALNPTNASVDAAEEQVSQQIARGESTIAQLQKERESLAQRQAEIQTQLIQNQTQLEQTERDLAGSVIRATTDGIVFKLTLSNPSQVVRPGDSVAQIAPNNAPLVVKASVANQDIDKVEIGQTAKVRIDACPYPDYGILQGMVTAVAPDVDTQTDRTTSSTTSSQSGGSGDRSFEVTIQPDSPSLIRRNRECQIQSGMQASASIISREETFLQFVLRKARLLTDL